MASKFNIHPVISAVPTTAHRLKGREKVTALGQCARKALVHSSRLSKLALGTLEKRDNGAPIPCEGVHWSLTHKEKYVAAVCAPFAIGIDIEHIRPYNKRLHKRIADDSEWDLAPDISTPLFFRYWTAKEAVLKAVGIGMVGLSRCRIQAIVDNRRLTVTYEESTWHVVQYWGAKDHVVAVTANHTDIEWHQLG